MNNVYLNIVANAQFQQVYAEVAKLKEAMLTLQKTSVGGPFTPANVSSIKAAQSAFDSAVVSTRAFNIEQVAMASNVEKFGKALSSGKLSLGQYYNLWRQSAKGTSAELDALATSQARLNRSIAIADPLRPGYAKLVTDINGVVTAQEKATFYQKALNTAIQQGSIKLIDFGKNTQWMGRQLTVGLTMPLAMFGAGASAAFLQVDKELTRMQKVYGTGLIQPTQAALTQIRSDVMALGTELAKTLGTSVKETASMAADLAATGLEGTKLLDATKEAIRLATLGELDHQQAMQATVSLQNVYKLSTQGLSEAVNFLNAVENQTSTSLQDLVDAIPRVGPIVQQLGGSFKDTAAMMVAMKEAGVPAAQGANAIKSALSSLINPTKAAKDAFAAYNINVAGIAKATNGNPIAMLKMLADQIKGLDKLAQAQLIEKMFGKFQVARVQALLSNINKVGSQTQTVFNLMGASTQDLSKLAANELKQQTESASGKFKRMTETLKADILPIGNAFLKTFSQIGFFVDKIISAVKKFSDMLGPAAKIFGTLFGAGLGGLIVIGPIIMLVGLFSNLFGNILRGANSIRMFKQGMDAALPSENKFMAGLHGMRNFYQELDKSTIAARNQMDLMPEAITSNAKAFEILSASIETLTKQFTALAIAQSEAMGMGGMPGGSVGASPFKIPFRAPGHINGIVGLSGGIPGKDSIPAMLAPNESVMTSQATAKYGTILSAMNAGTLEGHMAGNVPARAHAALPFVQNSPQFMAGVGMAGLSNLYAQFPEFIKVVSNLVVELPQELNVALVSGKASIEEFSAAWASRSGKFLAAAKNGGADVLDPQIKQALAKLEEEIGARTIALAKGTENQTVSDELMAQATRELIDKYKLDATKMGEVAVALDQASMQIGQVRTQFPTQVLREGLASGQFTLDGNKVMYGDTQIARARSALTKEGEMAFRPASSYNASGSYARKPMMGTNIAQEAALASQQILEQVSAGALVGIRNAAGMHSPATEYIAAGEQMVDSNLSGIESQLGSEKVAGEKIGQSIVQGVEESTNSARRSGMSSMMRMGVGTGVMMGGTMLGGALGGAAGSAISGGAMMGSMAMMMPGVGTSVAVGIAALGAAIPLVTSAFKNMAEDLRVQSNQIKGSFELSSAAITHFGIKFTPLSQYDFSGVSNNLTKHATSIKNNKSAVDQLTQAYLSASDQITKDYIKGLGKSKYADQKKTITQQYYTDIASGRSAQEAMQDITSAMTAAGIGSLSQQAIRGSLDLKATPGSATNKMLRMATNQKDSGNDEYERNLERSAAAYYQGSNPNVKFNALNGTSVKATTSALQNLSGISTKAFDDATKAINKNNAALINSDQIYNAFAATTANGDAKMIKFADSFRKAGGTTTQYQQALRLINAQLFTSDDILSKLKGKSFDKAWLDNLSKLIGLDKAAGIDNGNGNLGPGAGGPADYTKQYTPLLKKYQGILKLVQDQTNAQKKYNDQLKATQDYHMKQMDYFNQMKMAFTSGNYLGALMAQNGAKASQADFKGQMQDAKNQDMVQNLQDLVSRIQEGQSSGKSLSSFLKDNKIFSTSVDNVNWQKQLFGGVDKKTFTTNTGSIIAKANAAAANGTAAANQGAFQTLVVNVSADNSVVPETFASTVASKVLAAQKVAQAKTAAGNKVGTNGNRG